MQFHGMLRVLDEDASEPDGYLYPASKFVPIELPEAARRALMPAKGKNDIIALRIERGERCQ